jgi:hypothetical protein
MNFDEMPREDLLQILGSLKEAIIEDALRNLTTEAIKRRTDTLHTLLCTKEHGLREIGCHYLQEEDDFKLPTHKVWVKMARDYPLLYQISPEKFDAILGEVCSIQKIMDNALKLCPEAPLILVDLLSKAYCSPTGSETS